MSTTAILSSISSTSFSGSNTVTVDSSASISSSVSQISVVPIASERSTSATTTASSLAATASDSISETTSSTSSLISATSASTTATSSSVPATTSETNSLLSSSDAVSSTSSPATTSSNGTSRSSTLSTTITSSANKSSAAISATTTAAAAGSTSGLSNAAIAGIATVALLLGALVIGYIIWWFVLRKNANTRRSRRMSRVVEEKPHTRSTLDAPIEFRPQTPSPCGMGTAQPSGRFYGSAQEQPRDDTGQVSPRTQFMTASGSVRSTDIYPQFRAESPSTSQSSTLPYISPTIPSNTGWLPVDETVQSGTAFKRFSFESDGNSEVLHLASAHEPETRSMLEKVPPIRPEAGVGQTTPKVNEVSEPLTNQKAVRPAYTTTSTTSQGPGAPGVKRMTPNDSSSVLSTPASTVVRVSPTSVLDLPMYPTVLPPQAESESSVLVVVPGPSPPLLPLKPSPNFSRPTRTTDHSVATNNEKTIDRSPTLPQFKPNADSFRTYTKQVPTNSMAKPAFVPYSSKFEEASTDFHGPARQRLPAGQRQIQPQSASTAVLPSQKRDQALRAAQQSRNAILPSQSTRIPGTASINPSSKSSLSKPNTEPRVSSRSMMPSGQIIERSVIPKAQQGGALTISEAKTSYQVPYQLRLARELAASRTSSQPNTGGNVNTNIDVRPRPRNRSIPNIRTHPDQPAILSRSRSKSQSHLYPRI